jgi:uncharacterized membrane protein (DUF485 family)
MNPSLMSDIYLYVGIAGLVITVIISAVTVIKLNKKKSKLKKQIWDEYK